MLTYDVRIYSIETRRDRPKPYRLRWLVGTRKHSKSYTLKAQADGRRSELMTALRNQEQFEDTTGLPVSELRARHSAVSWYEHSRAYIDRKWAGAPVKSRKGYADAPATITPALVTGTAGAPAPALLRKALYSWAFNRKSLVGTTAGRMSPPHCAGSRSTRFRSPRWKTRQLSGRRWTRSA